MYVLALLASLWTAEPCEAAMCRCWLPVTAYEARDSSEAVFTGVVVSVRETREPFMNGWSRRLYTTFRVEAAWKGVETPEMVIVHAGTDCDYEFESGKRYMVYAARHPRADFLFAGVCSRTHQFASYQDDVDLRVLGPPVRFWATPTP